MNKLLQLYDLRVVVVVLGLWLMFGASRPEFLGSFDQWIMALDTAQLAAFNPGEAHSLYGWQAIQFIFENPTLNPEFVSYWHPVTEWVLITFIILMLTLWLPRCSLAGGAVLTGVLMLSVILTQIGLWTIKQQWWPLGTVIQFGMTGYLLMLFWLIPHQQIQNLQTSRHRVSFDYSKQLVQQGKLTEALDLINNCYADEDVLELCYQIALAQERKRQYAEAAGTYRRIICHNNRFKDAADRLRQLESVSQSAGLEGTLALAGSQMMAGTLAVATSAQAGISKPVLGRYEVIRELGRGAMGIVYLGNDPKLSRAVAIKTLNYAQFDNGLLDDLRERFFREAEAAARLNHPNIVTVFDVGEETDVAYIAMDYIDGESLDNFCRADQLLAVSTVYELMAQVADALAYAHDHKIIHRDIKPSNLLYDQNNGLVKVSDFGIARISDESRTRTGQVMGSPLYMSPEQLKGFKLKGTSDLFSLGATFYQLLTGTTPFQAETLPELTLQIINKKHPGVRERRPELPASAVRIINKALQKDPAKRYQSAKEFASQLRKALASELKQEVA